MVVVECSEDSLLCCRFANGTMVDFCGDEVSGFKVYGRRRTRGTRGLLSKAFFDKPFSIKASSAKVRNMEVSYPDRAALREMGLEKILMKKAHHEFAKSLDKGVNVSSSPQYKVVTLTASQFASPIALESMTLELLLPNDELPSSADDKGRFTAGLREQALFARGSFAFKQEQGEWNASHELLLDGVDLVRGQVTLPMKEKSVEMGRADGATIVVSDQPISLHDTSAPPPHVALRLLFALLTSVVEALLVLLFLDSGVVFGLRVPEYLTSSLPYFLVLRLLIYDQLFPPDLVISTTTGGDGGCGSGKVTAATASPEAITTMALGEVMRLKRRGKSKVVLPASVVSIAECSSSSSGSSDSSGSSGSSGTFNTSGSSGTFNTSGGGGAGTLPYWWHVTALVVVVVLLFRFIDRLLSIWYMESRRREKKRGGTSSSLSFLVHAYNSWGFCGSVHHGESMPFYSMPGTFVKAFHDGSPSLAINASAVPWTLSLVLWRAFKLPWWVLRRFNAPLINSTPFQGWWAWPSPRHRKNRPYIASDMNGLLSDRITRHGFLCGFLSQRQQFGCVSFDRSYRHLLVRCSLDGVRVNQESATCSMASDWLLLQAIDSINEDPLAQYMVASGTFCGALTQMPHYCHPPHPRHVKTDQASGSGSPKRRRRRSTMDSGSSAGSTNYSVTSIPTPRDRGKSFFLGSPFTGLADSSDDEEGQEEEDSQESGNGGRGVDSGAWAKFSPATPPSGWCSWYHFFEKVTEADLVANIALMRDLKERHGLHAERQGFNLFQVDDGYQRAWGDWLQLEKTKFPSDSLATVVDLIQGAGMTAGLWLAPFSCDKHSHIAERHPEWILRNNRGVPCNSANCGKWFYGLDTTHPEVRQYVKLVLSTVTKTWGFTYLKLDFLYSAVLADGYENGYDRSLTRAQILHQAMELVTSAVAGLEICLLGCGSPLGAMIGHVHANRVSPDAGLAWLPEWPLPATDKWNLPSARGMLRNSLSRMGQHGRWWVNDPDCMLLRDTTHFTEEEVRSIATVKAMSGGSFVISDDLGEVPLTRVRVAQQMLPATNLAAVCVDLVDMEMPELLRLSLGVSSRHAETRVDSGENAGLGRWTVFAACHWDEENGNDYYFSDAGKRSYDIFGANKGDKSGYTSLEHKSHYVTLAQLLGEGSAMLRDCHTKYRRSLLRHQQRQQHQQQGVDKGKEEEAALGIVLLLYEFWSGQCHQVQIGPSRVQNEDRMDSLVIVLPSVQRHGANLYAVRIVGIAGTPGDDEDEDEDEDEENDDGEDGGPTTSTSTGGLVPSRRGTVVTLNGEHSDTASLKESDSNDGTEVDASFTAQSVHSKPVYVGSNLHFSGGLEVAEMVWLRKDFREQPLWGKRTLFAAGPGVSSGSSDSDSANSPTGDGAKWTLTSSDDKEEEEGEGLRRLPPSKVEVGKRASVVFGTGDGDSDEEEEEDDADTEDEGDAIPPPPSEQPLSARLRSAGSLQHFYGPVQGRGVIGLDEPTVEPGDTWRDIHTPGKPKTPPQPTASIDIDPACVDGGGGRLGLCCVVTFHEGSVRSRLWGGHFLLLLPVAATYDASAVVVTTSVVGVAHTYLRTAALEEGLHLSPRSTVDPVQLSKLVDRGNLSLLHSDDVEVAKRSNAGLLLRVRLSGPDDESPLHQVTRVAVHY